MSQDTSWTSADLELLPDDGKRYEIIDGELHVSKQPGWHHQFVCGQLFSLLQRWSDETQSGQANIAPGVIFSDDGDVAPDVVADLDINGQIIGLEILNASKQLGAAVNAESVPIEQLVGAMVGARA